MYILEILNAIKKRSSLDKIEAEAKAQQKKESKFQQWASFLIPLAASIILPGIGGLLTGATAGGTSLLSSLVGAGAQKGILGGLIKGLGTGLGTKWIGEGSEKFGRNVLGLGGDPSAINLEGYSGDVQHAGREIQKDLSGLMGGMDWGKTGLYSGLLAGVGGIKGLKELGGKSFNWGKNLLEDWRNAPSIADRLIPQASELGQGAVGGYSIGTGLGTGMEVPGYSMELPGIDAFNQANLDIGVSTGTGSSIASELINTNQAYDWRQSGLNPAQQGEEQQFQEFLNQLFGGNQR